MSSACVCHIDGEWCFYCEVYSPLEDKYNALSMGIERTHGYLSRRIARVESKVESIKSEHGPNPSDTHNYFGGQSLGYWQGRLSALLDLQAILEREVKDFTIGD